MRTPEVRIEDMLEAIQRINKYAVRGKAAFVKEELIQTYVVHNLQILGEADCKLTPEYCTTQGDGSIELMYRK